MATPIRLPEQVAIASSPECWIKTCPHLRHDLAQGSPGDFRSAERGRILSRGHSSDLNQKNAAASCKQATHPQDTSLLRGAGARTLHFFDHDLI